ncbi:MAG TPA: DoxX family protein [Devosiaceae bacterium]|jgi:hypothetical protein
MSSTTRKWAYWASTAILSLLYLASAGMYISNIPAAEALYQSLGYPGYLVPLLIVIKPLGVLAILTRLNVFLSNLAYAGMFYHLLLAFSAHINAGQYVESIAAVIGLVALIVSFLTQNSARAKQSPYPPLR